MIKGHSLRYYIRGNEGIGPRPPRMENDTMAEEESMAYELQDEFESKARGFGKGKYGRILKMARTPSREEYVNTLYITLLGSTIIGAAGFSIWWLMTILPTYF